MTIEQAIENTRSNYYFQLQNESKDITAFVKYFLDLISKAATIVLNKISQPELGQIKHVLLPRRQELLNILHDHKYDLLALQKGGYIKKLGVTRGSLYVRSGLKSFRS